MRLGVVALVTGFLVAALVAGLPASASDQSVAATAGSTWDPSQVSISVGEKVTWSNPQSGFHNVCVSKPASAANACDEFRNGAPGTDWSGYTNFHTFTSAGTYKFYCEIHGPSGTSGMVGTVTVGGGGGTTTTATGTSTTTTTTITDTTTTPTQTTPTQTQTTQTAPADTTAPHFTGKLRRRSSRRSLIIQLGSSEDAKLKAVVRRRAPGARTYSKVGQASVDVHEGRNTVTLPRKASGRLRSGSYKVTLTLEDEAGNLSGPRVLSFKLA